MEQSEFLRAIQNYRRRLNLAGFFRKLVSALGIGAVIGILLEAVSFVVPFYYAGTYAVLALFIALLAASAAAYLRRTGMEQTALVMDSFGFDERIVTAYGNLDKEGVLVELQRADAMEQLQTHQDKIQITLLPPWKRTGALVCLLVVLLVLVLVPSEMKDRAEELHNVKEEVEEKAQEIEEIVEALRQMEQQEGLTPEQQALLQEMIESLQFSQSEYQQASSDQMMRAAAEKLDYRYENMGSQLAELAQSLQSGAAVSPVTAESMQALAEKMQGEGGSQLVKGKTGQSDNGHNGVGDANGQGGKADNNGNNGGNGQDGGGGKDGQSGQSGNSGNGEGQSGNNGGSGQDGSQGSGRGTGSGSTPHDYVSIPNDIADSGNLTGNAVDHDASEYFHAQNGLSWEGTHMSHEAVIGSYAQNAYEGIAAGKYPSGMEEIIKEYFSNFN